MAKPAKAEKTHKRIAENRRARRNYFIDETVEAGLILEGSEVKSLRAGGSDIADAYAEMRGEEMVLVNAYIPEYKQASYNNHEPRRPRQLLLHKREVERLASAIKRKGVTLVALEMYFNERGIAKISLGVGRGKKLYDKRETDKSRDWGRQKQRILNARG